MIRCITIQYPAESAAVGITTPLDYMDGYMDGGGGGLTWGLRWTRLLGQLTIWSWGLTPQQVLEKLPSQARL